MEIRFPSRLANIEDFHVPDNHVLDEVDLDVAKEAVNSDVNLNVSNRNGRNDTRDDDFVVAATALTALLIAIC